jgi:hypothetical protein
MIDKEKLRDECVPLFGLKTISACNEILDIYANCLLNLTDAQKGEEISSSSDKDGRMVLQMIMTKILYLKNAINGIEFEGNGIKLNKIIDPTVISSMVRSLYETSTMFNLIYRSTNSDDEKEILYLLWVSAGLKFRQKFALDIDSDAGKEKLENEKDEIAEIEKQIEEIQLYKDIAEKDQGKIKTKIKEKDYLIRFVDNKVEFLHWHQLAKQMGFKEGLIDNIYTYFSLYAHPSNVSVFQFEEMFKRGEEVFYDLTYFNIKLATFLTSSFIADYISVYPAALEVFNKLELKDQIAINFHNTLSRGYEYSINDSHKELE